ncbi:uncharacterized protein [Hetaerina americana]|uniref:uncharacterized protein isoform X2 n=1 Tax=Hetaerina americana TaxID=62018 RepID=UPI003A7F0F20
MCDKAEYEVCRLCLNSRGVLINVFGENRKLQFMMENTIEDLIKVKVVEDANYPWLVCSTCMEKLTEFRLFKRRCAECLSVFKNRIQKGFNPTTKDRMANREEFPSEIQKDFNEYEMASDAVDSNAVDAGDGKIIVKEEIDPPSLCSDTPEKYIDSHYDSHLSSNDETRNLDPLEDGELNLSFNEEVFIKEECDVDVPQEEGYLGAELLQDQGT